MMEDYPQADDPSALDRFVAAQEETYDQALAELRRGRKQGHWMWFIFPQLRGLGQSRMSWFYGIADAAEAGRYLSHPILGPRLITCGDAVLKHGHLSAETIFGPIDAVKLRSSATLFSATPGAPDVFHHLLETFFDRKPCPRTLGRAGAEDSAK
ncbi:DUF1810 domain-containing protein [Paracoccus rhizosphaerae]|uniref:DUF1810 domain-containing protein n=1 Tax=Paracoccus rhizosphaerae TaxID=1133347 RepID=A0ABV6CHX8_9RHOB|nr:DUF1810 domain-containing protein [Paracoccus rhizosphaerae]